MIHSTEKENPMALSLIWFLSFAVLTVSHCAVTLRNYWRKVRVCWAMVLITVAPLVLSIKMLPQNSGYHGFAIAGIAVSCFVASLYVFLATR